MLTFVGGCGKRSSCRDRRDSDSQDLRDPALLRASILFLKSALVLFRAFSFDVLIDSSFISAGSMLGLESGMGGGCSYTWPSQASRGDALVDTRELADDLLARLTTDALEYR